ncbi:MAG: GspH/FimT family pseudopilin [Rhodanobacter sp.]
MTAAGKQRSGRPQRGSSLVEQIMVLAIIGIITGIALPPLHHLLSRNRLQVAQGDFMTALQHARSTAANTGKRTLFCPSPDGNQCSDGTRWERGWLLGHDTDRNHQPDSGPLFAHAAYDSNLRISSSNGRHEVHFEPDGSAGGSNLTLLFCEHGGDNPALSVVVSNAGRIRGAPANAAQAEHCLHDD